MRFNRKTRIPEYCYVGKQSARMVLQWIGLTGMRFDRRTGFPASGWTQSRVLRDSPQVRPSCGDEASRFALDAMWPADGAPINLGI